MSYRSLYLATALLAATACSKADGGSSPAPTPSPGSAAPAVAVVSNGSGSDTSKQVAPSQDLRGIGSRLNYESLHRPPVGPTAEQVFAALGTAGVKLTGTTQYLGVTMGAAYCAGGSTSSGLGVAVCEYADGAAASAGKKMMDEKYGATARPENRQVRRGTVLTLTGSVTPDVAKPAFAAFNAL